VLVNGGWTGLSIARCVIPRRFRLETIQWSDFKRLSAQAVEDGPCLKVTFDGRVIFYVVVNPIGMMMQQIEARCSQIDAARPPKTVEAVT